MSTKTAYARLAVRFHASATVKFQFFNLFNAVMFNDPAVNLQRPQTFGVISSQMNSPRIIQLGLQVNF